MQPVSSSYSHEAFHYYANRLRASVERSLRRYILPDQYFWVRNFTCQRAGWFGKRTRYPEEMKSPELRAAIAAEASRIYAKHGYDADVFIDYNPSLGREWRQDPIHAVGSGYQMLVKFKRLPAKRQELVAAVAAHTPPAM